PSRARAFSIATPTAISCLPYLRALPAPTPSPLRDANSSSRSASATLPGPPTRTATTLAGATSSCTRATWPGSARLFSTRGAPAAAHGNNCGWGDLQLHPRDMARLGQLFLQRGRSAGRQIIPEDWLRIATRAHVDRTGGKDHYGYYWWVSAELPGLFEAVGRGGQRITVWPDKELVLVYTGGGFEPGALAPFILKSLNAVNSDKPDQPPSANPEANARLRDKLAA